MPFQLKDYQRRCLDELAQFLRRVIAHGRADLAFYEQTGRAYRQVRALPGLPYVCVRVPTGDAIVLVLDGSGAVKERYLQGPDIDQPLAEEDASGDVRWFLADQLGTVRDVVDSDGGLLNHVVYDTFGNVLSQTDAGEQPRFAFAGRELDAESGLYYNRLRYYDPAAGRFISEDPIGFAGGDGNLYRYVGNSPLVFTDPWGLEGSFGQGLLSGVGEGAVGLYVGLAKMTPLGQVVTTSIAAYEDISAIANGESFGNVAQRRSDAQTGGVRDVYNASLNRGSCSFMAAVDVAAYTVADMAGLVRLTEGLVTGKDWKTGLRLKDGECGRRVGSGLVSFVVYYGTVGAGAMGARGLGGGRAAGSRAGGAASRAAAADTAGARAAGGEAGPAAGVQAPVRTFEEITVRSTVGADGGTSMIVKTISKDTGETLKVVHRVVDTAGNVIHEDVKFVK